MFFRQLYDVSLSQASYLIGCQATGEAIVVDPVRDAEQYVRVAQSERLRIVSVTETHIHADFVSGSRELSALTGARVMLSAEGGPDWRYEFASQDNAQLLHDGDVFNVGNIQFDVVHTPGHTPEHISFVVTDKPAAAGAMGVITGDFVFVGDVGRPDLLEKVVSVAGTMEPAARTLFHSLNKFRALPDHLQVWPGHGAGSACGKSLGAVPFSTVGYEKLANWALNVADEGDFVRQVLDGQPEAPAYFASMKRMNKAGPRVLRGMPTPPKLAPADVYPLAKSEALIVDLRPASTFAAAHIPGALSIPYSNSFATWAGSLVPERAELTLMLNAGDNELNPSVLQHAVRDLAAVGLDRVTGWIDQHALTAWCDTGETVASVPQLTAREVHHALRDGRIQLVDVRNASEWKHEHIAGASNMPLTHLARTVHSLSPTPIVTQCQSGGRSATAASVLRRAGYKNVMNLSGGIDAWVSNKLPVERSL